MRTSKRPLKTLAYLKSKSAILFDMDGTLFNTEPLHAQALRKVLLEEDMDLSTEELEHRFIGVADDQVFRELLGSDCDTATMIIKKNKELKDSIASLSKSELLALQVPGMIELLTQLKEAGLKLALISASENEIVDLMVEHSGIGIYLDTIVGRSDTERSKPFPDPYLFAMKKLAVDASNSLIFEDSPTGLQAAMDSGAEVIKVDPNCTEESEETSIANYSWL